MLVVAPVAAPLDRVQLRKFLFPLPQDVGFDGAQFGHLAYREIAFGRNGRQGFHELCSNRVGSANV
jgi:hypothetical protein